MSRMKSSTALHTLILIACLALAAVLPAAASDGIAGESMSVPEGWSLMASTPDLNLFMDTESGDFAVEVAESGALWFSVPRGFDDDPIANDLNKARLASLLEVTCFTARDQRIILDSRTHSIGRNLVSVRGIPGGALVTYGFSNRERGEDDVPLAIDRLRFENLLLPQLTDEERREFQTRYILDEDLGIYYRYGLPRFKIPLFLEALDRIGYSADDLALDEEAAEIYRTEVLGDLHRRVPGLRTVSGSDKERIELTIPMRIVLDGDSLHVSVDFAQAEWPANVSVHSVALLEHFGAGTRDDEGYMLVPDGSGALINFNNGKTRHQPYSRSIYGEYDIEAMQERRLDPPPLLFPVYGILNGGNAVLAVIEDGDAQATLNADVSGRRHSFNTVGPEFRILEKGSVTIGSGDRKNTKLVFPEEPYMGRASIRYRFLSGADASYSGMAALYRRDLESRGILQRQHLQNGPEIHAEVVGAVTDEASFLGIPYKRVIPLSRFADVAAFLEEVPDDFSENLILRFSGYLNGGLDHRFPSSATWERKLGNGNQRSEALEALQGEGITLLLDATVAEMPGFSNGGRPNRDASRYVNQSPARIYDYNPATARRSGDSIGLYVSNSATVAKSLHTLEKLIRGTPLNGYTLTRAGSMLYPDYRDGAVTDRQSASEQLTSTLSDFRVVPGTRAVNTGILPSLVEMDRVFRLPLRSGGAQILDEDVPFAAMVLSGSLRYSGEPLNMSPDPEKAFLECLESGADLAFLWTMEDTSILKDTKYNSLYATDARAAMHMAEDYRDRWIQALGATGPYALVRHTRIDEACVVNTFSNGRRVAINFGDEAVNVEGLRVPPGDFVVLSEEVES